MININSFYIVGGDLRQLKLATNLAADGYIVSVFGFDKFEGEIELPILPLEEGLLHDCIILPLPITKNGTDIAFPLSDEHISINELFEDIPEGTPVLAGMVSEDIANYAKEKNILLLDYYNREEIMVLNAIPTAEGAVQIALEELPITLHGSNALILGFGRIGKVLADSLSGLCCNVTAAARKHRDFAWIRAYGYKHCNINQLGDELSEFDVIFNTAPHQILNKKLLSQLKKECVVIDLASKPGGVDFEAAARLGTKVIWALSLPGKVAPVSAAAAIQEAIYNLLKEEGFKI
jgi:dipicolinate synthase subunit A